MVLVEAVQVLASGRFRGRRVLVVLGHLVRVMLAGLVVQGRAHHLPDLVAAVVLALWVRMRRPTRPIRVVMAGRVLHG